MGSQCCRSDGDAEEASGSVPATLANEVESFPVYSAPAYTGSDMSNPAQEYGGWSNGDDDDGGFAPLPPQEDAYGNFAEPPAPSLTEDTQQPKAKDKKKVKDKKEKKQDSQDHQGHAAHDPLLSENAGQEPYQQQEPRHHEQIQHPPAGGASEDHGKLQTIQEDPHDKDKVYGHPGMTLQIYLDSGWADMGADEMNQINMSLKTGNLKATITSRGAMYIVDMTDKNNMTQMNPCTRKERGLRIVKEGTKGGPPPKIRKDGEDQADAQGAAASGKKKSWFSFMSRRSGRS